MSSFKTLCSITGLIFCLNVTAVNFSGYQGLYQKIPSALNECPEFAKLDVGDDSRTVGVSYTGVISRPNPVTMKSEHYPVGSGAAYFRVPEHDAWEGKSFKIRYSEPQQGKLVRELLKRSLFGSKTVSEVSIAIAPAVPVGVDVSLMKYLPDADRNEICDYAKRDRPISMDEFDE